MPNCFIATTASSPLSFPRSRFPRCWASGVCAVVLSSAGLWSCSDDTSPSKGTAALDPKPPAAAMSTNPSDQSADTSADSAGTRTDPAPSGSPAPTAPSSAGNEGGAVGALNPSASGGETAAAGGEGNPGATPGPGALLGTATRPQLAATAAPQYDVLAYLASAGNLTSGLVRDNWDPTAGVGDVATFAADFRVAATGGTHTSVQAAVTAAVMAGGTARRFIEVAAGTYRELVCVPSGAPPLTLYGASADAAQTVIAFDNYSGKPKAAGESANPCNANLNGTTFGTSGSATFAAFAPEFQAKNLSFVNDTNEATVTAATPGAAVQAVALMAQGDRQIYENVRVLGNQDSLFLKTPNVETVLRAYFKGCYVEGDTDFIFGRATFVLDGCTIRSLTSRTAGGVVLAPSTDSRNPFGILVTRSSFEGDATAGVSSTSLGRAWDESQVDVPTYTANVLTGVFPNGQAVVRESTLGAHIQLTTPWRPAATTARPYSSVDGAVPANRFYEFGNQGPGSAPALP
jgi:pectinesterase